MAPIGGTGPGLLGWGPWMGAACSGLVGGLSLSASLVVDAVRPFCGGSGSTGDGACWGTGLPPPSRQLATSVTVTMVTTAP